MRLFFLGHLPQKERGALIDQYCRDLKQEKAALEALVSSINLSLDGRALTEVESFRMQTLRFGVEYYTFSIDWYEQLSQANAEG